MKQTDPKTQEQTTKKRIEIERRDMIFLIAAILICTGVLQAHGGWHAMAALGSLLVAALFLTK